MRLNAADLRRLLVVDGAGCVEVESKWKLDAETAKPLRRHLREREDLEKVRDTVFLDQYLDTERLDLLRAGASLRLRYRKSGAEVYLQYKGPGLRQDGLHIRPEHRSRRLDGLVNDGSGGEMMRFNTPSVRRILEDKSSPAMLAAMRRDLGADVVDAVDRATLLCQYRKEVFHLELDGCSLSPSVDRLCVFRVEAGAPLAMSTFWEYEDQAEGEDLEDLLAALPALRAFDEALAAAFGLRPESLDKYRRCASGLLLPREPVALARPAPLLQPA